MKRTDTIKDIYGRIIGFIQEDERGNKTLKNEYSRILGYYNSSDDTTRDEYNRPLYRGDRVSLLLKK